MSVTGKYESPHLSHSAVDSLLSCGARFRLERVLKAPQLPAWYFVGGSVVHSATELMDRTFIDTGEVLNAEQIQILCDVEFHNEIAESSEIEPDTTLWGMGGRKGAKEGEDWWRENAPKMVGMYQELRLRDFDSDLEIWTLPNGEPAIELQLMVTFGDVPVKMAIDRVLQSRTTGDLIVMDIKAGSREPQGYQLPLYGEAVRRTFGHDVRFGTYMMARKGTLTFPKDLRPLIADLDNRFAKARIMVQQEIFLAVPNMFCNSCGVRSFCSAQGGSDEPLLSGRVS